MSNKIGLKLTEVYVSKQIKSNVRTTNMLLLNENVRMLESMRTLTLNEKQRRRCEIVTRLIAKKITSSEANELLGVGSRQMRRIRRRYEADGIETVIHGNQGPTVTAAHPGIHY